MNTKMKHVALFGVLKITKSMEGNSIRKVPPEYFKDVSPRRGTVALG